MNKFFIIDGNAYLHRAYHALPPFKNAQGKNVGAIYGFMRMLAKIIRREKPQFLAVVFDSPEETFRHKEFKAYKATRPKAPEELIEQLKMAPAITRKLALKTIISPGWEADDTIASLVSKFSKDAQIFILSSDKDAVQLVGENVFLYDEMKDVILDREKIASKYGIPPEKFSDWLALTGDVSDNVPGAHGIGPAGATRLIREFGSIEEIYKNIEKVPPKIREILEKSREDVFLSKRLVSLARNVPISESLDEFTNNFSEEKFLEVAREMNFHSLAGEEKPIFKTSAVYEENLEWISSEKELVVRIIENGFIVSSKEKSSFVAETDGELAFGGGRPKALEKILLQNGIKIITDDAKKIYKRFPQVSGEICDISLMGYILDGRQDQSLRSLAEKILKMKAPPPGDLKNEAVFSACGFLLEEKLKQILEKNGQIFLYEKIELPLARVLASMERWGIKVDASWLGELSLVMDEKIKKISEEIFSLAGEPFNINSPAEVERILFVRLKLPVIKKGKLRASSDASVLKELAPLHPICGRILEYRNVFKLKTTFVDVFPKMLSPEGRLQTTYNSTGTLTGRLSSFNPNLQNIPARGEWGMEIRKAFIPEDGFVFLSADYSQIDLRVFAHLSGDENLVEAFRNGEDIHTFTARKIFSSENITPAQRKIAKTVNFGIVYGISPRGLAADLSCSMAEAKKLIDDYWKKFPRLKEYVKISVDTAQKRGFTETIFKRRRIVWAKSPFEKRVAVNTPIQGSSSDIIKKAMVEIFKLCDDESLRMILQVHDELLFEIKEDLLKEFAPKIAGIMENCVSLKVPLKVNLASGKNYGEMGPFEL